MKQTLLINPANSSLNLGDEIIVDGVKKQIDFIIGKTFVTSVSSHLPLSYMYKKAIGKCDFKFVCGSNLLMGRLNGRFKQWHIGYKDINFLKESILVGAGWWQYNNRPNMYTAFLYKRILSKKYIHSVRDEYTVEMLKSMGINNVLNTGCATMWELTKEHCEEIPKRKSDSVVFTLTDYNKDKQHDKAMIELLLKNYSKIYFWPQGVGDYDYLVELGMLDCVKIIRPALEDYDCFLLNNDVDFIGTRLHGGIRALQKKKRTIIISVDNRAIEKKKDFNLVCVPRGDLESLEKMINSEWTTEIRIPIENINRWKNQFR